MPRIAHIANVSITLKSSVEYGVSLCDLWTLTETCNWVGDIVVCAGGSQKNILDWDPCPHPTSKVSGEGCGRGWCFPRLKHTLKLIIASSRRHGLCFMGERTIGMSRGSPPKGCL